MPAAVAPAEGGPLAAAAGGPLAAAARLAEGPLVAAAAREAEGPLVAAAARVAVGPLVGAAARVAEGIRAVAVATRAVVVGILAVVVGILAVVAEILAVVAGILAVVVAPAAVAARVEEEVAALEEGAAISSFLMCGASTVLWARDSASWRIPGGCFRRGQRFRRGYAASGVGPGFMNRSAIDDGFTYVGGPRSQTMAAVEAACFMKEAFAAAARKRQPRVWTERGRVLAR